MDNLEYQAGALWADLLVVSLQPIELSEIEDLFAVVTRGAASQGAARRLGPTHAVVRLAAAVVAGRYTTDPNRSALCVVVGAYLAEPALSERWFGYSLDGPEAADFAVHACASFALDLMVFCTREV